MLLATGLVIVVAYLPLSINTYLETSAFGVLQLGCGRLGPTEAGVVLVGLNTALALGAGLGATVAGLGITVLDVVGLAAAAVMLAGRAAPAAGNLRELARREPPATPRLAA